MKKILCFLFSLVFYLRLSAQAQELEQLRLNLEKLAQFKLMLSQMKSTYRTLENGYNAILDVDKSTFTLHQNYLDGLLLVSPTLRNNPMVNRIYNSQQQLAVDFKTLLRELSLSNVFTTVELSEVRTAFYAIEEVVNTDVKLLVTVLTPNKFRMSDGERTDVVSKIKQSIDRQVLKLNVLRDDYYKQMILRSQKKRDIGAVRKLGTIH
ncbi:MAG: hypothetical protein U1C70_02390 [Sediminibacterium sp.]|jgi:hypothetical protein|uniref:hypothetical protein n=1 Tax=Sediminibacterium sp. TaxID=1917865 RepID=UPI002AB91EA0|nr:hypothetical protein [Sediminibacterium sp.]MDZ4070649.1 hypothetical protein [Sediminibacterium sp.]